MQEPAAAEWQQPAAAEANDSWVDLGLPEPGGSESQAAGEALGFRVATAQAAMAEPARTAAAAAADLAAVLSTAVDSGSAAAGTSDAACAAAAASREGWRRYLQTYMAGAAALCLRQPPCSETTDTGFVLIPPRVCNR